MVTTFYPVKKYPQVGVCGLDCGLCSRYHTDGKSRCPGCCGSDFFEKHTSCSFVTCAVKTKRIESCAECNSWDDCDKLYQLFAAAAIRDSFISYKPVLGNLEFIKKNGIQSFSERQFERQKVLLHLLNNYDDGRAKLFYCSAVQLLPPQKVYDTVVAAARRIKPVTDIKEKAKFMRGVIGELAESLQIDIQLRNK